MTISAIVAIASDGSIGNKNDLLWHLSSDLKRFKQLTTGHCILMGRRTFQSLPNGALPHRTNLVVSNSLCQSIKSGEHLFASVEEAVQYARERGEEELFVIGGAMLYKAMTPYFHKLYLTIVDASFPDADTHWDEGLVLARQGEILHQESIPTSEKDPIASTYLEIKLKD